MGIQSFFLIQPEYRSGEVWSAFARREGLLYEALEFSAPPVLDGGALYADCLAWYRASGLVFSLHGAFIDNNPASGDADIRRVSQSSCHKSCALAAALGARQIVFHASAFPFLRSEAYLSGWAEQCAAFYAALADEYGLTVCVENSADLDPDPLLLLMRRANSERVRVCLDIGHANYSRAPLARWFEALGSHLACLHLSDNNARFDDHLALGAGCVEWALADRLWRDCRAPAVFTLEVDSMASVARSLAFLRERGYFGTEG